MTRDSLDQKTLASNHGTWRHINRVQHYLTISIKKLLDRSLAHDQSKLEDPEATSFANAPDLTTITYDSPEYKTSKEAMAPALAHHYANNSHHPEHFKNGVKDMTLFDVMEMLCDWKASSERHVDGNIRKSIQINAERFGIDKQLRRILENTVRELPPP